MFPASVSIPFIFLLRSISICKCILNQRNLLSIHRHHVEPTRCRRRQMIFHKIPGCSRANPALLSCIYRTASFSHRASAPVLHLYKNQIGAVACYQVYLAKTAAVTVPQNLISPALQISRCLFFIKCSCFFVYSQLIPALSPPNYCGIKFPIKLLR